MSDHVDDAMVTAWRTNDAFRNETVEAMTREISKNGSIGEWEEDLLGCLGRNLLKEEVLALFTELQKSMRSEEEWRDEFLAIFSTVKRSDLPGPIVDEEQARRWAMEARARQEFELPPPGNPDIPF